MLCLGVAERPARSANRFSMVARSVLPSSSSGSTPERRMSDSIRARRFSRPSMYLALRMISPRCCTVAAIADAPFRRLALLLHLCEYALCLVVLAMRTRRHLAITLDLLLSAHIAGLCPVSIVTLSSQLYVPWRFSASLGHPGHCGHPYRLAQTCSVEAATGRTGRCQTCAEAAGSSLAAVHRRNRSVRCSWRRG
jgi:hypothetical protein